MKDFETIDAANLDNVNGGDLSSMWNSVKEGIHKAYEFVKPYLPQLPHLPGLPPTIPLGPFYPPKKDGAV